MAVILCSRKLWTSVASKVSDEPAAKSQSAGGQLGSWALTRFDYEARALVVALNHTTCLTVVFEATPPTGFRRRFRDALEMALLDHDIDPREAALEADAVERMPLGHLRDRSLTELLSAIVFVCQCELDYTDDLRRVQANANKFPHPMQPSAPAHAIRRVFAGELRPRSADRLH